MFNSNGYSLSDIAAVSNNDGFGGSNGGAWWILVLFLFVFWGRNGWGNEGNNNNGGALTRGEMCQDMNFADLEAATRGIQSGLCDGFYAMNTGMLNGFSGLQGTISNEFRSVDNAICNLGYQTQSGINGINVANMQNTYALQGAIKDLGTQYAMGLNTLTSRISDCCCEAEKMNMQNRYDMQTYNCNTLQAIDKVGDRIIDYISQRDYQNLRDENLALKFSASQAAQNTYLVDKIRPCPEPAYVVPNPYACNGGFGFPYNFNVA